MTPKEKAEKLFTKFADIEHLGVYGDYDGTWEWSSSLWRQQAKESAIIAVDEIIEALSFHSWQNRNEIEYWEQVKHEIQKL
jgi:hypothetical protein